MLKVNNHDAPSLTKKQIDEDLDHPIGLKTIKELAKGKHVIIARANIEIIEE